MRLTTSPLPILKLILLAASEYWCITARSDQPSKRQEEPGRKARSKGELKEAAETKKPLKAIGIPTKSRPAIRKIEPLKTNSLSQRQIGDLRGETSEFRVRTFRFSLGYNHHIALHIQVRL